MYFVFQVVRSKSTGSWDRKGLLNIHRDNTEYGSNTDSNSDSNDPSSYSNNSDYDEKETAEESNFKITNSKTFCHGPNTSLKTLSSSDSSINESESDECEQFSPELFGLLDNPGVVRFDCVDYPLAVTEDIEEEYVNEQKTGEHWIRVSCDDLTNDNNVGRGRMQNSDKRKLSKSVDDINSGDVNRF